MFNIFNKKHNQEKLIQEQQQKLEDQVLLAEEVKKFLESNIGKYVLDQIKHDQDTIKKELIQANAFDPDAIVILQNKYNSLSSIKMYLAQAINNGNEAYFSLKQGNMISNEDFNDYGDNV